MTLNELRDKAYKIADDHGFHNDPRDFATRLMLIVSELSEAMEADRKGQWRGNPELLSGKKLLDVEITRGEYKRTVKGFVEEEIADAIIRLLDLAGIHNIDLDWHVKAKMAYNETQGYKKRRKKCKIY